MVQVLYDRERKIIEALYDRERKLVEVLYERKSGKWLKLYMIERWK